MRASNVLTNLKTLAYVCFISFFFEREEVKKEDANEGGKST